MRYVMFSWRWSAKEISLLRERYEEEGTAQLAMELGRSEDSVSGEARRLGLRFTQRRRKQGMSKAQRSRAVNIHFFDQPSPEVAYVLGYLWCRATIRSNFPFGVGLRCPMQEVHHLLDVRAMMNSVHAV